MTNNEENKSSFKEIPAKLNETSRPYNLDVVLHQLIELECDKHPDAPAVLMGKKQLTFFELNSVANRFASYLISKGVGPEKIVAVIMNRSLELPVTLLAILKAGGSYLPIDPTYPKERIVTILNDAEPVIIISNATFDAPDVKQMVFNISLDTLHQELETYPSSNPSVTMSPVNAAYVIYTSGSTGIPKGVVNTHCGIVNRLLWMQEFFTIDVHDAVLQKTPYTFDVSVWEFFWPMLTGARLVMTEPDGHRDPDYLLETIRAFNITTIHFVPSMLIRFLDVAHQEIAVTLKRVICSGEALSKGLQDRFYKKFPDVELINLYGPTEAAVDVTWWKCENSSPKSYVPIGYPVPNTQIHILRETMKPCAVDETGELFIGGVQVARGYLKRPELTSQRFITDQFSETPGAQLYRTGDLARYTPDGSIEYLGRIDTQVKIRGLRIELGEIEQKLSLIPEIQEAVAAAKEDITGEKRLIAYVVTSKPISISDLRTQLAVSLPAYMIPELFVFLNKLPLSSNGKVDRSSLPEPDSLRPATSSEYIEPRTPLEREISVVWKDLLRINKVGVEDNFFEIGGNSLLGLQVVTELKKRGYSTGVVDLFAAPTVEKLADLLQKTKSKSTELLSVNERATRMRIGRSSTTTERNGVAVVGMAGRFPGAATIDELWSNLITGKESISWFSPDQIDPLVDDEIKNNPDYIPARGIIDNADMFDAAFFGISPHEAEVMDPQQRVFLELAWSALEHAGYDSEKYKGKIGVYAGCGDNHYYTTHVLNRPDLIRLVGRFVVEYCNQKDYIATRAAYACNCTGPAVSASTGCSTTLLAVDNAFRALLDYECDMALAGGVDISVPQRNGQIFEPGGPFCKDGHCRPFDDDATGTMFCDGAGVVVLKRLDDALDDGDTIYAVIRGSAKNNDGSDKVSFLAPSVNGQAQAIALAQASANVTPTQISYIEAHGTATPVGDPIEVEALSRVFRAQTDKTQFCYLGSIKGNIGHPTIAAGVAGLIKVVLSLVNEKIPATLHFKNPNHRIDFKTSPFLVADKTIGWPRGNQPRIAGISSFGFGGTNVHTIVEEGPLDTTQPENTRPRQLILLSAKTETALEASRSNLATFFETDSNGNIADTTSTLQQGRRYFTHRTYVVCSDTEDAITLLKKPAPLCCAQKLCTRKTPDIVFMFPGQGAQYVNMGKNLYDGEPVFKSALDTCCEILKPYLGCELRNMLFPEPGDESTAQESLQNTFYTQPAIFTIEYALSMLWNSWGIRPAMLIGHSIGEFTAAVLSGVMELSDALGLIALRGKLMQQLPRGTMLSVRASASEVEPLLPDDIQLAAVNGPKLSVVSGPIESIETFTRQLEAKNIPCRPLHTSHAFHSAMMDPVVGPFTDAVKQIRLNAPTIPVVSTLTGTWLSESDATDPDYWGRHLRSTVRFSQSVLVLLENQNCVFLEVGPRNTLTTLTRQHFSDPKQQVAIASLSDTHVDSAEYTALLRAIGELWINGTTPDWEAFYRNEHRKRIPLPTYPFMRKRFWAEVDKISVSTSTRNHASIDQNDTAQQSSLEKLLKRTAELQKQFASAHITPNQPEPVSRAPVQALSQMEKPAPDAKIGRDPEGNPGWYIPDTTTPGNYIFICPVNPDTLVWDGM